MKTRKQFDKAVNVAVNTVDLREVTILKDLTKQKQREKTRRHREKVKQDPELDKLHKAKDAERKRISRQKLKEQCQHDKALAEKQRESERIRKREYRQRKKSSALQVTDSTASCSLKKSLAQKKRREKERDRKRKAEKYQKEKFKRKSEVMRVKLWRMKKSSQSTSVGPSSSGKKPFVSPQSEKHATKRAADSLPQTPAKRAKVLERIVQSSPRCKKILEDREVIVSGSVKQQLLTGRAALESLKESVSILKPSGTAHKELSHAYQSVTEAVISSVARKHRVKTVLRKYLTIGRKAASRKQQPQKRFCPKNRKQRKDRVSEQIRSEVATFYLSAEVSRVSPGKRDVMKLRIKEGQ